MDCIPYINDLQIEINILKDIKKNNKCDVNLIDNQIKEKEILIEKCKNNLKLLSNNQICYRLYLAILDGMTPSKAIEKISNENYQNGIKPVDIGTLWKKYYKKVKKVLETQ